MSNWPVFMALFLSVGNGLTGSRRPVAVVRTKEARRTLDIEFGGCRGFRSRELVRKRFLKP